MHDCHSEHSGTKSHSEAGGASQSRASDGEPTDHLHERLRLLPKEVGVVLMTFGITGLVIPGPLGTPFIIAGGLVLAPRWFHRTELWVQKKFPNMHHEGRKHVNRFLDDFEKRFPRHGRA